MQTMVTAEAPRAYLFQCRNDSALLAVSLERNADNIPPSTLWYGGWRLRREVTLGHGEPTPSNIDPTAILRGVRSVGYYIWRNGVA